MSATLEFRMGTDNQTHYAGKLLKGSAYLTLLDAAADLLDRDPDDLLAKHPSVEEATRVISALEKQQPGLEKEGAVPAPDRAPETTLRTNQGSAPPASQESDTSARSSRPPATFPRGALPRFLTARHLRQIATGQRALPESLDDDAAWVLERLGKALQVEAIYVPPQAPPINGNEPLTIEHLKAVFGDVEAIASTLGVSLPTVKAWGGLLPEHYSWKVEGLSKGRLRVPR